VKRTPRARRTRNTEGRLLRLRADVNFTLEATAKGTLLTVVESGFDNIALHRCEDAFRMNDSGWAEQLVNIERHVTASQ
jgi:hypothetical protein